MSKKIILYLISCVLCLLTYGQKEDYNWIIGSSTLNQIMFDDNGYVVDTFTPNPSIRIHVTNASISDSLGSLQLFSGGTAVYSAEGDIIPNGDSLNPGFVRENFSVTPGAYSSRNGGFFVPSLNHNGYRFFHLKEDTNSYIFPSLNYAVGVELYYSIIKNDDNQYMVEKKTYQFLKILLIPSALPPAAMAMAEIGG